MFQAAYIQMCLEQGRACGEASFVDVIFMCCGC